MDPHYLVKEVPVYSWSTKFYQEWVLEFVFSFSVSVEMMHVEFVSSSLLRPINFVLGYSPHSLIYSCSVLSCTKAGPWGRLHQEHEACQPLFYSITSTVMFNISFLLLTLGLISFFSVVEAEIQLYSASNFPLEYCFPPPQILMFHFQSILNLSLPVHQFPNTWDFSDVSLALNSYLEEPTFKKIFLIL